MSRLRFCQCLSKAALSCSGGLWALLSILLRTASWLLRVKAYAIARRNKALTPFVCLAPLFAVYLSFAAKWLLTCVEAVR